MQPAVPTRSLLSPCVWWLGWNGESRDTKGLRAFKVHMLLTLFRQGCGVPDGNPCCDP